MLEPKYRYKGQTIIIDLPEECGHEDYYVECTYKFDKKVKKYALTMYLMRHDIENKFKLSSQNIDTQYIPVKKEDIVECIYRIVLEASLCDFFEPYIQRYEYELKCFECGDELYEQERLDKLNGGAA